ncbi:hypothetical protein [Coralloluteibacterium thermophilus]|uniref:Uncharacterized protein n=1 Tax=Coralloluteibacterium thermophilum TaxID=2707049 RepID=A0ABV9NFC1_9GAMM
MGTRSPDELVISERYRGHIIEAHIGRRPEAGGWELLRTVVLDGDMRVLAGEHAPQVHPSLGSAVDAAFSLGRGRIDRCVGAAVG